jgi:hypothetical protein
MKKKKLKKIKKKVKDVMTNFDKIIIVFSVVLIWR